MPRSSPNNTAIARASAVTPPIRPRTSRHLRLQRDIEVALAAELFSLDLHPRACLATGALAGMEARIAWRPHRRAPITPARFLRVAETTGQALRIGGWLLRAACRMAAGAGEIRVCVALNGRQLEATTLIDQITHALDETGLPPDQLEIEIAEHLLTRMGVETLLTLSAIRDLGVGLALDDFGTGLTSLALLRRLPLTAMKLGRILVQDLPWDREDAAIVRAIIETGHALGLDIIAEGIEAESQHRFLAEAGCDFGQGSLFESLSPAAFKPRLPMTKR